MPTPTSPAVATALTILELLGTAPELGVSGLARKLGMGKSSVHRLLNTLASRGYVEKNPVTARYRLSYQLFAIAASAANRYGLNETATPVMERLAAEVQESVNLAVLRKDRILTLHRVQGPHPIQLHIDAPGGVVAHATALGKALLAGLLPGQLRDTLAGVSFPRLTPNTITTFRILQAELRRTRERGFAVDDEECSAGVRAVAAPIRDRAGSVVAAVSIAGPTHRMTDERLAALAPKVMAATVEISQRLGWPGSQEGL